MLRHSGVAGEMHRHLARMRHAARRAGARGESKGCAATSKTASRHPKRGSAAASRDDLTTRGARRDDSASLIEAGTVAATEAVAAAGEASPAWAVERHRKLRRRRRRTRGQRPTSGTTRRRSPQATARQLHRRALRSNAGPHRPRRGTADRPATLTDSRRPGPQTRRRARQHPSETRSKKLPRRNRRRFGARRSARSPA